MDYGKKYLEKGTDASHLAANLLDWVGIYWHQLCPQQRESEKVKKVVLSLVDLATQLILLSVYELM